MYYYGERQPVFNNYPQVHFEEGLPQLNDAVFDGREPTMIVVDDHMSDVNQLVADIFTKISHHRNISVLHLTQNLFDKNKYARTISLNSHYWLFHDAPPVSLSMTPFHDAQNCAHSVLLSLLPFPVRSLLSRGMTFDLIPTLTSGQSNLT